MSTIEVTESETGTVDGMKNGTQLIKTTATWLMIFMLALAACIVTIVVVNNKSFGPEGTVSHYLKALEAGDGAKALGLLQAKVPAGNAAGLDRAALSASMEGLKDLTIGDAVDGPDGQKIVTVSYTIDDVGYSTEFKLVSGSKQWLFFDTWQMVPGTLPHVDVSVVNANQASINGVDVNMPDGRNSFAVFYPGRYEFEYRSPLFAAPPVASAVTGQGAVSAVGLATGPTSELLSQVDGTIRSYLDACTEQAVLMPTGCPMSASTDNRVVSDVKWSILEYPTISITPYGGQWVLAPLTGKAEVAYQEQNLFTGLITDVKVPSDFTFSATLSINGTDVNVTPVLDY